MVLRRDSYVYSVGDGLEGVRFYGGVRGVGGGGRAVCGATGVRRYFSQAPDGVSSSPAQI